MRLGLIRPGMSAASRDPFLGFEALGITSDDPDDPRFTSGGGGGGRENDDDEEDDDDDDEDEDEDEEPKSRKRRPVKKSRQSDEDDEDDDDDEDRRPRAVRQAAKYRVRLRAEEAKNKELQDRIKTLENSDKPQDEVLKRDLETTRGQVESLTEANRIMMAQLAFFKTPVQGVTWIDASDVFALAEREGLFDDVIDEDGTVDTRELRRGLKDLAKRKPHLVQKSEDDPKARGRKSTEDDEDDEDDEDEPRSRRSAGTMNGQRKGKRQAGPTRESLAKKFPVLGRV